MIAVPDGGRVHLALVATDMRKGFCGLALLLQEVLRSTQPSADGTVSVMLSPAQLSMLVEGLEWRVLVPTRRLMIAG